MTAEGPTIPPWMWKHPPFPIRDADGILRGGYDWLGREFRIGDMVMYCIGAGRGQMMAYGKVLALRINNDYYGEFQVQVLTHRTSGHWDNQKRTRPAWVNPMNITAKPNELPDWESGPCCEMWGRPHSDRHNLWCLVVGGSGVPNG